MGRQSIPKFYKCDREIHRVRVRRRMHIYKQQLSINWCMRTSNLLDYCLCNIFSPNQIGSYLQAIKDIRLVANGYFIGRV